MNVKNIGPHHPTQLHAPSHHPIAPRSRLKLASMLRLGKYRGLKFEEAAEQDRSYAAWVLRERALPKTLGDYKAYLYETRGGILNIGKHRGKWFKEVVEQDPRHGGGALKEKPR